MFITTDKQINNFYIFIYVYIYVKDVFMAYLDTTARLLSTSNQISRRRSLYFTIYKYL
jgi:hypothetical protein